MSDIQTLIDMGFDKERVEYALNVTNNQGVEPAMEWLLAHCDEDIPANKPADATLSLRNAGQKINEATGSSSTPTPATVTGANTVAVASANAPGTSTALEMSKEAKSLKCRDCGKLCPTELDAEFHAAKTGHSNFEESTEEKKPLTEEEKRAQLDIIEEKLRLKRLEREEREKLDALDRERSRIKSGKDMTEARKRLEELEMKKIVEQRKREKAEEKAARERVRAQIAADKEARKAKTQPPSPPLPVAESPNVSSTTAAAVENEKPAATKAYTHTRIQIRLQDGSTLVETFNVKEQLSAVRVFIQVKTNTELPFGLMTSFPRKVFDDDDYEKPLEALGLVPSAVLIMTKG